MSGPRRMMTVEMGSTLLAVCLIPQLAWHLLQTEQVSKGQVDKLMAWPRARPMTATCSFCSCFGSG